MADLAALCADCAAAQPGGGGKSDSCARCGGRRIIRHGEIGALTIAHLDCDAFYAAVEKRDNPALADRPVIVGGGVRGVVTTACYVARTYGVRSAMPMFKALKACPEAVVVRPDFGKYAEAAREVRRLMRDVTPAVEPLSIDEAFLDLAGGERLFGAAPAQTLALLQGRIKSELGFTVSVGLSWNKFLAKIASDFDKPNGYSVIGRQDAASTLAPLPVRAVWGVGEVAEARLAADGVRTVGDIQRLDPGLLVKRYGETGLRLSRLAFGEDHRPLETDRETKSVSAETTFARDIADRDALEDALFRLCDKVSTRMKEKDLKGRVVTLKLKTAAFKTLTRRRTLDAPSNLLRAAFDAARPLLAECLGPPYRLIGIGYGDLLPASVEAQPGLFVDPLARAEREEAAIDDIRRRFGRDAIAFGRAFRKNGKRFEDDD